MHKSVVASVALLTGIAIASPMIAWSANGGPQTAQPAPAQPSGDGMHADGGRDAMGGHAGWMRGMMRHRMAGLAPRQRCEERLARRAGMVAYTVARLNLTATQRPLWDKLNGQLQVAADKQRRLCQSLPAIVGEQTLLDRVGRREQFLAARLDALRQMRPALEQFYQALSAEQKAIVDHPFRRG